MKTQIPLVYDKELKFYLEFFIGMELLKDAITIGIHYKDFKQRFDDFFFLIKIPVYTKYQIFNALEAIEKYSIIKTHDLFAFQRTKLWKK